MGDAQETVYPSGQHYSARNRVPNIKQFVASLDRDKRERDAEIDEAAQQSSAAAAAEAPKDRRGHANDAARGLQGKHRRTVRDPVTGNDVEIDDLSAKQLKAAKDPLLTIPNANLGKASPVRTEPHQSGEQYRNAQDATAPPDPVAPGSSTDVPTHGSKTNVLFHPTPAVSFEPMFAALEARANVLAGGILLATVVVGRLLGGSVWGLVPLGACLASGVFLWAKDLIRQGRAMEWSSERKRGETAVLNLIPESAEWMNMIIGLVWGLINPEMFAAIADTLEDVMQASVPSVIEGVKVNDITQGSNPIRVLSVRALPDSHMQDLKDELRRENERTMDPEELAATEEGGDFLNLEMSVAYHSAVAGDKDAHARARARHNMGMQLIFYLGVKGLFGVPFPVWVELKGLLATARVRVALAPDPPFVKTVSFTLMGLPKVEASCVPLVERGANILNLPVISNFVNYAIQTAANMYVAPKSMTLDVGKMLLGDGIKKDTQTLGVLLVRIQRATGLSKQDRRGSKGGGSDPYICVSFSKFGKPLYCTRVIQDDLNPVFDEHCALLVTADVVKADEQLSLELWDSDRTSADDVVGKVLLSIQNLMQHPGRMFPQTSKLMGLKAGSSMPGELHWEVGYFCKAPFRAALRTDGRDPALPSALRGHPELQDPKGALQTALEDAVVHTPPDPLWPSGVLSVVVHQMVNLELASVKGSFGRRRGREYEPARPDAGEAAVAEQHRRLPSSYCTILVNDELAYKTRTKQASSKPIFEAGTERFVRDWRACAVTVTARDARNRQHDPIIGVVSLRLADVLRAASQSTRWYPLAGGVGFGRVRISLLFRSVELRLPPPLLGFGDVGTFEFLGDAIRTAGWAPSEKVALRLRTGGSSASVGADACRRTAEGDGLEWNIGGGEEKPGDEAGKAGSRVRLPVRYRYRSPVFFELRVSRTAVRRGGGYYASLWLQDLEDAQEQDFDLPIWRCDNGLRLSQNYITEANRDVPDLSLEEVGRLRFRGRFKPGTDRDHVRFVSDNDSRETIESWEACLALGARDEEAVAAEVPDNVRHLHEESLAEGSHGPEQAGEALSERRDGPDVGGEDRRRMMTARDGLATDWEEAIGGEEGMERLLEGHRRTQSGTVEGDDSSDSDIDLGIKDATNAGGNDDDISNEDEDDLSRYTGSLASPVKTVDSARSRSSAESAAAGATANSSSSSSKNPIKLYKDYKSRSRDLHRKQRGLMQWKAMRNLQFVTDEAVFAARRLKKAGSLNGRTPDVETEI